MLEIQNLSYHPPAAAAPIFQNIELQLDPQQLGVVVGPSGSGKVRFWKFWRGLCSGIQGQFSGDRKILKLNICSNCRD
jgi:energy-coupling factor transport system ATP-binding protein